MDKLRIELYQKYFDVAKKRVEDAQRDFTMDSTSGIIEQESIERKESEHDDTGTHQPT